LIPLPLRGIPLFKGDFGIFEANFLPVKKSREKFLTFVLASKANTQNRNLL
jgi:hypothetical protein